jgi:hypothetical protein
VFDRKFEWAARITGKDFTGWVNSTTCDDGEAVQCLLQRMHLLPIEVPQKHPMTPATMADIRNIVSR